MLRRLIPIAGTVIAFGLAVGCGSTSGTSAESPAAKASSPSPSASPPGLLLAQVATLTRTLFYGEEQAYASSLKQGKDYDLAHDYPGSVDKSKFLACAATFEAQHPGETVSAVPEINTLAPDPNWVGSPAYKGETDWLFAGKKPHGQTYILTVDITYTAASGQQQTANGEAHVTILNGTAYYYVTACGG